MSRRFLILAALLATVPAGAADIVLPEGGSTVVGGEGAAAVVSPIALAATALQGPQDGLTPDITVPGKPVPVETAVRGEDLALPRSAFAPAARDGEEVYLRVAVDRREEAGERPAALESILRRDVESARETLSESVFHGKWNGENTTLSHACCGDAAPKLGFLLRRLGYPVDVVEAQRHYYLLLPSAEGQLIIDPTIRQFFGGPLASRGIPEIFVGTAGGLNLLFQRHAAGKSTKSGMRDIYFSGAAVRNARMETIRANAERIAAMKERGAPVVKIVRTPNALVPADERREYEPIIRFARR